MLRSLKILVVDDDIDNAQSLGELFETPLRPMLTATLIWPSWM
jgi:CheY-like chemotaxis protein